MVVPVSGLLLFRYKFCALFLKCGTGVPFETDTMKYFLYVIIFLAPGCGNKQGNVQTARPADSVLYYPYQAIYTDGFENGHPANALLVLELWKELENGDIRKRAKEFSDSLHLILPDQVVDVKKDEALNLFQKRRNQYSSVQYYVDAWMPLKAKNNGDELVVLWGKQDCTRANGKRDYQVIHEIWRFDKQGKIRQMEQYLTHPY